MSDWREFLGIQLAVVDAMETALRRVSAALSHDLNVPVVLTLPYPDARQREFGAVSCADFPPSDGERCAAGTRMLNFSRTADRVAGAQWYVSLAVEQWKQSALDGGWTHLSLSGFYWVFESVCGCVDQAQTSCTLCDSTGFEVPPSARVDDEAILPAIAADVHSRDDRLIFTWVPY